MRKFLTGVLAAITVICAAFGLAGCGKKHNNGGNGYDHDKEHEQDLAASKAVIAEAISSVPSYLKGGDVIIGYTVDNSIDKKFYFAKDEDSVITFYSDGYDTGSPLYDTDFFADYISTVLGIDDKEYDFTAHNAQIQNINGEYYTFYGRYNEEYGKYTERNYYTTEDQFVAAGNVYNFLSGEEFLPLFDVNSYSNCSVYAELRDEFHNGTADHEDDIATLEATDLTVNGKTIETVRISMTLDSIVITFVTGERSSEVTIYFPGDSEYVEKIWGFASYGIGGQGMNYDSMSNCAGKAKSNLSLNNRRDPIFFYMTRDRMPDLKNGNYRVTINKTINYVHGNWEKNNLFRKVTEVYENDNGKVKKTADGTDTYFDFVSDKVYETFEGKTYYYTLPSSDGVIERQIVDDSIYLSDVFINKIYNFDIDNLKWDGSIIGQIRASWINNEFVSVTITSTDSSFTFSYYNESGSSFHERGEITFDKIGECSVTVSDGDEMTVEDVLDRIEKTDVYTTSNASSYKGTVGYVAYGDDCSVVYRKINGENYIRDRESSYGKSDALYKADDSFYNSLSAKNNILYKPFFDVNNYKKTSDGYSFDCDLYKGTAKLVANKIVLDITEIKFDTSLPGTYYLSGSSFIKDMSSYSLTYAESPYHSYNYYSSYFSEEFLNSAEDYSVSKAFNLIAAKFNDLNYDFFGSGKYDGAIYGTNNKLMFPTYDDSTLQAFYVKDGKFYSRVLIDYSSYNSLDLEDKEILEKYLGAKDEYVRRNGKFIVDKLTDPSESGYKIGIFNPVVNGDPLADLFGYLGTSGENIQMLGFGVFAIKTDDGIRIISFRDDRVSLQG